MLFSTVAYSFLSNDSTPVCSLCFSRTFSSDNGNCLVCPNNCKTCKYDENNQHHYILTYYVDGNFKYEYHYIDDNY